MAVEFYFIGGPNDGKRMRDDVFGNAENQFVEKWWVGTNGGAIGKQFFVYSDKGEEEISKKGIDANFIGHWYEVVKQNEAGDDIIVECEYRKNEYFA